MKIVGGDFKVKGAMGAMGVSKCVNQCDGKSENGLKRGVHQAWPRRDYVGWPVQ